MLCWGQPDSEESCIVLESRLTRSLVTKLLQCSLLAVCKFCAAETRPQTGVCEPLIPDVKVQLCTWAQCTCIQYVHMNEAFCIIILKNPSAMYFGQGHLLCKRILPIMHIRTCMPLGDCQIWHVEGPTGSKWHLRNYTPSRNQRLFRCIIWLHHNAILLKHAI